MDDRTRRKVAELVAGIIVSDDEYAPAERDLTKRLYAQLGLSDEVSARLFPIVDRAEAMSTIAAMPSDVQHYALDMLIVAAVADGRIVANERRILDAVATAVGLTAEQLQQRIDSR